MVTSPGFPEYLDGRDGRREVLSEADAALSIGMEVRRWRKMADYLEHSARRISRSARCGE